MNFDNFADRKAGWQYQDTLRLVFSSHAQSKTQQGEDSIDYLTPPAMRFDLRNGVPLITERNLNPASAEHPQWQQAIGELIGFLHGATTLEELAEFGCYWWKAWVTEEKCRKRGLEPGDLGPGSYGAAFHDFPTVDGGSYNQVQNILEQMVEMPHLKTHIITPFIPQYIIRGKGKQQKVVVVPCHGFMHFRIIDKTLTFTMVQRSGDMVVGVPNNMIQYAALLLMVEQHLKKEGIEIENLVYVHQLIDAHYFTNQIPVIEKLLSRKPKAFPTLTLDPKVDFWDTRVEHFTLSDYYPHPGIKNIPVAV